MSVSPNVDIIYTARYFIDPHLKGIRHFKIKMRFSETVSQTILNILTTILYFTMCDSVVLRKFTLDGTKH